jgi:anaerobic magnesium-protoporphyrin IX monomethyl ester cyclase
MKKELDVLFIAPSNPDGIYQDLAKDYAGIEPPTWACLLAESCRSVGYKVGILDTGAERLGFSECLERINSIKTRLICFVVYGQNVNAGTTMMSGAVGLTDYLRENGVSAPISFIGSHVQALPYDTLKREKNVDIVFTNEGVYALRNLLSMDDFMSRLNEIKGIGYRVDGNPFLNAPEKLVPNDRMDIDLPGYAWDLLPFDKKPFDLYRCPMWHAEYDHTIRSPYASINSSLGCQFGCDFCMINIINRNDNDPIGVAGNYSMMRYWSTEFVLKQFDKLVEMGVYNVRIIDEMFLLNPKYYIPLCEGLVERGYGDKLRMWAYSRVDTIKRPGILSLLKDAGIKWLGIGIESGDHKVRLEVSKGKFEEVDIKTIVNKVEEAGINVMGNYIFGLPSDSMETMQKTLDLSLELATLGWNGYSAMPLPGSKLYKDALLAGHDLPKNYTEYSFHSYDTKPVPNENLTSEEILRFRDEAYTKYHTSTKFLDKVRSKYGQSAVDNILENTKIKLKRKHLGD